MLFASLESNSEEVSDTKICSIAVKKSQVQKLYESIEKCNEGDLIDLELLAFGSSSTEDTVGGAGELRQEITKKYCDFTKEIHVPSQIHLMCHKVKRREFRDIENY
jgi:hypothetical protein